MSSNSPDVQDAILFDKGSLRPDRFEHSRSRPKKTVPVYLKLQKALQGHMVSRLCFAESTFRFPWWYLNYCNILYIYRSADLCLCRVKVPFASRERVGLSDYHLLASSCVRITPRLSPIVAQYEPALMYIWLRDSGSLGRRRIRLRFEGVPDFCHQLCPNRKDFEAPECLGVATSGTVSTT